MAPQSSWAFNGFLSNAFSMFARLISSCRSCAWMSSAFCVRVSQFLSTSSYEGALQRRVVIERAKGILMERHGVDERQAFELLREQARSSSRRVLEVARSVIDGHVLLPRNDSGQG